MISVVVCFYNMRREAARTLYTLTRGLYQIVTLADLPEIEVIAIDNGSPIPIDVAEAESFGVNLRYFNLDRNAKSPAAAINFGVAQARGSHIVSIIDGAHMLSPGMLSSLWAATSPVPDSTFAYSLALHLGPKRQNLSMMEGYNQEAEDKLLDSVPWQTNGYSLFDVASLIETTSWSVFSPQIESSCFMMSKSLFWRLGGFDERFTKPGGGLVALDLFKRTVETPGVQLVKLVGEASFHQFHGGVSTNVPIDKHPIEDFGAEYTRIRGCDWSPPRYATTPVMFGAVRPEMQRFCV